MTIAPSLDSNSCWPALPLSSWQDTCETLHMWSQIVGKVRLAFAPPVNHWWNVPLYVNARGLTTSSIPYGSSAFELQFDFVEHRLELSTTTGHVRSIPLAPRSVAAFYRDVMDMLRAEGIEAHIWHMPVEVPNPMPFDQDERGAYDRAAVEKFWQILNSVKAVFDEFRSGFIGKCSPVHFFWGSFDLAVTRFSGRRAPDRPDADPVTREAYSHEVSSVGFWPGAGLGDPAFYSYAAPEPEGFSSARVRPHTAHYDPNIKEFILMYDEVRRASSPASVLLDFCESTYEAAATLGRWDRDALERRSQPAAARLIA
jgi:Family of unknown function (DUF5996)